MPSPPPVRLALPLALVVPGARIFSRSVGLGTCSGGTNTMLMVVQWSLLQCFRHRELQHPTWTADLGEFSERKEESWTRAP